MAVVTPILGKDTKRYTDQSLTQMNYFVDRERNCSKTSPTRFLSRTISEYPNEYEEEDEGDEGDRPVIDIKNDDEATTSSGNSSTQSDYVFSPESESQSISQTSCSLLKDSESESESDSSSGSSTTSLELSEHETELL